MSKRQKKTSSSKGKSTSMRTIARKEANRAIKREIESKMYDGRQTTTVDYSGSIYNLYANPIAGTTITQGVGDYQYIGSVIEPSFVHIRGAVITADAYNFMRILVIQLKGPSAGVISVADLLQSVGNAQTPFSALDRDHDSQYRLLAQRLIRVDTYRPVEQFSIKVSRKKMMKTHFSNTTGSSSVGGLYIVFYSDSAAATHPTVEYYTRVTFKDA